MARLLVVGGATLAVASVFAESLRLGSLNHTYGLWQLAGFVAGVCVCFGGLALRSSRPLRFQLPVVGVLVTVLLVGVAVMVIANHSLTPYQRADGSWCYPDLGPSEDFTGEFICEPPP